jgi:hypothetical protein
MSLSDRLARHAIGTANELEDDLLEAATTIDDQAAEIERLRAERDGLHLAICGGEDAPGYAASLSHETVLKVLSDNYESARRDSQLAWDGETANTWKARALAAESSLDEAVGVLTSTAASLDAATSLLSRGGRQAAPSNQMFHQMLKDYEAALADARDFITKHSGGGS